MELIKLESGIISAQQQAEFERAVELAKAKVEEYQAKYGNVVADASTPEGYKLCKQIRAELQPIASGLEKARQAIKSPVLNAGKLIDDSIKPLHDAMKALYKPHEDAYREVDNEKKRREEERQARVDAFFGNLDRAIIDCAGQSFAFIESKINDLSDWEVDPAIFHGDTDRATKKLGEVIAQLSAMAANQQVVEKAQEKEAELARREKEIAEKEAQQVPQEYMQRPPANQAKSVSAVTTFQPMEVKAKAHSLSELSDLTKLFGEDQLKQMLSDGKNQYPIEVHLVRALPEPKAA